MYLVKVLFLFIFLCPLLANGQTKLIWHKSHSGSKHTFAKLLLSNDTDFRTSNFGHAPRVNVKNAQLDSVIFVNDTTQIMVTTVSCSDKYAGNAITREWNPTTGKFDEALEISEDYRTSLWKAGRDTVYHHEHFCHNEGLGYIKSVLDAKYNFTNPAESIVFIGYSDNPEFSSAKNSSIEVLSVNQKINLLEIKMTGVFRTFGLDYRVLFGLEKQNDLGEWEMLIGSMYHKNSEVPSPFTLCNNHIVKFHLVHFINLIEQENPRRLDKGIYRLHAITYERNEIVHSNEFTIN